MIASKVEVRPVHDEYGRTDLHELALAVTTDDHFARVCHTLVEALEEVAMSYSGLTHGRPGHEPKVTLEWVSKGKAADE